MKQQMIGRIDEIKQLQDALISQESELIAVTGRRRIGKTFLITNTYQHQIVFEMIGTQHGLLEDQLQNFSDQLNYYAKPSIRLKAPSKWSEAFMMLREYLEHRQDSQKVVLFFDELPWLSGSKSGFLSAFGYFWNSWATRQNLVVVICGSAASWMIQKVVNDRGGLHNRITKHIHLSPFTLAETEQYLQSRGVFFDHYQIVQLYMTMGGVPHYLKEIVVAKSAIQNIDAICFAKNGLLYQEFDRLYTSLFDQADNHLTIIRTLAKKKQGMTRSEIATIGALLNGGGLTKALEELILSGFITDYYPFEKKKKDKLYRLTDEYSLFYLKFIESNKQQGSNVWQQLSQTPAFRAWSGYAFESICIKHATQLKQALGIAGIYSSVSSFYLKGDIQNEGVQIDMLIDRNDHTINLIEIKFYNQPFTLTKEYTQELRQKMWRFQQATKTNKQVNWVMICTFGLQQNQHSLGLVSNTLQLEDLF